MERSIGTSWFFIVEGKRNMTPKKRNMTPKKSVAL